jgi:type VI secretion system (T6SS) baseplate-like injector VgrG
VGAGPDKSKGQGVVKGIVQSVAPGRGMVTLTLAALHGGGIRYHARVDPSLLQPRRGVVQFPEPGDEVLIAFEHGDLSRPYVVGQVWDGGSGTPPTNSGNDGRPGAGDKTGRFAKAPAGFILPRRPRKG